MPSRLSTRRAQSAARNGLCAHAISGTVSGRPREFRCRCTWPGAGNPAGIIMMMCMEMIWRIHISTYGAHMHAAAARRRSPHARAISEAASASDLSTTQHDAPARKASPWMISRVGAHVRDGNARGGQLGPYLLQSRSLKSACSASSRPYLSSEMARRCRSRALTRS